MDKWRAIRLEEGLDCLIDYRGKSPPKSHGGIPVISAKCVKNGRIVQPIEQTIDPNFYPVWMVRGFPLVGDIVITTEGPLGEVAQLDNDTVKFALAQRVVCMRGKRGVLDNGFLKFLLMSPSQQAILSSYATGTTVAGISQKSLRSVPITIPPYHEQVAIGELLGALDNKIDLNRRMNETLEAMARAVFKDWFVDFGPTRAKMEGSAPYLAPDVWALFSDQLDDEGKPAGWFNSPIKSSCLKVANGGTPRRDVPEYWNGGTVPWLTSSEVRKPYLIGTDNFITEAGLAGSSAKWVDPDATVVALYGATAGQVSFVATRLTTNQAVCALTPRTGFRYFNYLLLSASTHSLAGMATGSAQQNLSKGVVEEVPTIFGDLRVMEHFDATIDPCFKRIIANEKEAATLSATRDLLLPKLMSGEIRMGDAANIVEAAL
jgi:type I restriction enzyme S subunit